jgi:pSer/pThr/pTyr-binding forkhead associated (FHA) protein
MVPQMNLFQHSCGASGPLRLISGERGWSLPQPFAVIGRNPAADLVLNHPQVSRRHAYLQMIQGRLFCADLQSRTGIQWSDGRPAAWKWLEPGEGFRIGPFEVRVLRDDGFSMLLAAGTKGLPNPLEIGPSGTGPLLEISPVPEAEEGPRFGPTAGLLSSELTLVGTGATCGIRLPEQSVSRYQCAFVRTALGVWVIDLLGRHGIAINEMGVRYGRLMEGDELRIGPFLARLRGAGDGNGRGGQEEDRFSSTSLIASRSTALATTVPPLLPASLAPLPEPASPLPGFSPISTGVERLDGPALSRLLGQVGLMQSQMLNNYQQSIMMAAQMFATICRDELGPVRNELSLAQEIVEELRALKESMESPPAKTSPPPPPAPAPGRGPSRPAREPRPPRETEAGNPNALSYQEMCLWLCQRSEQMDEKQQDRWQKILRAILGAGGKQ